MYQFHVKVKKAILSFLDFFYPMFHRFLPLQTYRYAACGGGNLLLNIVLMFVFYNFLFEKQVFHLGFLAFQPHIASFLLAFLVTFPIGFYLSMFVVFPGSHLPKNIQLFRYFLVSMACLVLNYFFLKLFVDVCHWYPTPSQFVNAILVTAFSYISQRFFSFRKKNPANT